jgi:hypothetical protein
MAKKAAAAAPGPNDPTALTAKQLAEVLSKSSGQKVTVAQLEHDVDEGAPANRDGTFHLIHYTAWLAATVA